MEDTSRLCRQGKARLSREVASIVYRLGTSAGVWGGRMQRLFARERLLGSSCCTDRARLRELAQLQRMHHRDNLVEVLT